MKTDKTNKLEKYIPVRKLSKQAKDAIFVQQKAANDSQNGNNPTLPEVA